MGHPAEANKGAERIERYTHVGMFAGAISHAVNNIMGNIVLKANTALVAKNRSDDPEVVEHALKEIIQYAKRCAITVKSLPDYLANGDAQKEDVDINQVIARVVEDHTFYLTANSVEMSLRLGDRLPALKGSLAQLQFLIVQLLYNAIEAIAPGPGRLNVFSERGGESAVRIVIQDDGRGIDEGMLDDVFAPFFSYGKTAANLGLGLSASRAIVESHGGTIELDSSPGRGTKVTITLPVR